MKIVLYYAPHTCALVPYVTLTEAEAEFEVRAISLRKRENRSPEYLEINPKHKVPALIVDGHPLTENVAIQCWIARTFPQARLLPTDPWEEIQGISLLAWCASGIHPHLSRINSPAKYCDAPGARDSLVKLAAEDVFEAFALADGMLAGREFFFDHFTAVDAHFFWAFRRATQFRLDLTAFKNYGRHFEHLARRPSVQKLLAYEKEVQTRFGTPV